MNLNSTKKGLMAQILNPHRMNTQVWAYQSQL